MSTVEHKPDIELFPADLGLMELTADLGRRRTQPDAPLDQAVLQVVEGMAGEDAIHLEPGLRIAHYELIRELGRGAMGRVFVARDTKLGRLVAIKFLDAVAFSDRFRREAQATATFNHENIVVIHEIGEHEGRPYMVLEYLAGQPLRRLIHDQRLSPRRAVELMVPVVRALVCAHEKGIVHRDLKPDNIVVTDTGAIKVLDFGIAKLLAHAHPARNPAAVPAGDMAITQDGAILGTMPYMAPEQWRAPAGQDAEVDHQTDVWAVGIMLYEMVCRRHPIEPLTRAHLEDVVPRLDVAMPAVDAGVPGALARLIDECLKKHKPERIGSARELLGRLEALLRHSRRLGHGESPYAGLTAFQEQDAHRFFGRDNDIPRLTGRLRSEPLIAVVGPSGVGKSSLIRAGVVPALKRSGESWDVFVVRPGRHPVAALAHLVESIGPAGPDTSSPSIPLHSDLLQRLYREPGYLGAFLRSRARAHQSRILVFVDQFEELYTLVPETRDRLAFTACLAGVADDASTPLRVIVSMRSDFLDRAAEDRYFMDQLTGALMYLAPLSPSGLGEALIQPAEMAGYRFEDERMVAEMLDALEASAAALPLLQFTAARLWEARDRERRLLTRKSYEEIGGVAGALASHADDFLASLSASQQQLVRAIFERLVTPERTRVLVPLDDLCQQLSGDADNASRQVARQLVDRLVRARLLAVHDDAQLEGEPAEPMIEIVHESLIQGWPTLRRWLDEDNDKATFLAQLRIAARQWDRLGRPHGLLWRGEAMAEARHWYTRLKDELSGRERDFLDEVISLATRSLRRRRLFFATVVIVLVALVAATSVGLVLIGSAEREATLQALIAQKEAKRAREAEHRVGENIAELREANADTARALEDLRQREEELRKLNEQLNATLATARQAKKEAETESRRARQAASEAEKARTRADALAASERQARQEREQALRELKVYARRLEAKLNELGISTTMR